MRSLLRLPRLLRPYRWQYALTVLLLILNTAGQLAIPAILQRVIDFGLTLGQSRFMALAALALLAIGAIRAGVAFGQRYLSEWVALQIAYDLRNRLYDHIQHLSFAYHDRSQTGQLISRCIEDVSSLRRFTGFGMAELLRIALLLIGIMVAIFISQPLLAALALIPMIPMALATTRFGERVSHLFLAVDQALGDLSSRLQENVTGVQVVRAFAREPFEIQRFEDANRDLYDARVTVVGEWAKVMPTARLMVAFSTMLILWFGGRMVLQGDMTLGEIVAFNSYLLLLAQPVRQLAWLVNLAGEAAAGLDRVFEILDHPPSIQSSPHAVRLPRLSGRVRFQDVSFRYKGEHTDALRHVDLTVESDMTVGMIGPTGAGKTTMVQLIPRFYDVTEGAVLVDGVDVRRALLTSLRRQIGIVPQTSLLFSISIRENIAYGRPGAAEEEIVAAARDAQAHEFISHMPEGYDTVVGERGVTLSGGQRQRVAIARALLLDPRILILDDATSSVDTQTERRLQEALQHRMRGRTTFVIAQRIASVRHADLILVLEDGRIVERGAHHDLVERGGRYRQIYDLQLQGQDAPRGPAQTLGPGRLRPGLGES